MNRTVSRLVPLALALASLAAAPAPPAAAAPAATPAAAPIRIDLAGERVGGEPQRFLAVVGDWSIAADGAAKVVHVDGRAWKMGQPAGGLADKARSIYGARHEEFLDNVQAFAYFPYAVAQGVDDFHDGEISVRFRVLGGKLDQCAGILFDLQPNGDYLAFRHNGMEDNVVLWTFVNGKRSFVKKGDHDVRLELGSWHTLKVVVRGARFEGWLDGEKLLEMPLTARVSGKVGLWSKTDSVVEFADYVVTPEAAVPGGPPQEHPKPPRPAAPVAGATSTGSPRP